MDDKDYEPISFFKGAQNVLKAKDGTALSATDAIEQVRLQFGDALNARNLAFLFGSGCSSYRKEGAEVGIPTMAPMAKTFLDKIGETNDAPFISLEERETLRQWLGLKIDGQKFVGNLERLMEALYGAHFVLDGGDGEGPQSLVKVVDRVIGKVARFVLDSCTKGLSDILCAGS